MQSKREYSIARDSPSHTLVVQAKRAENLCSVQLPSKFTNLRAMESGWIIISTYQESISVVATGFKVAAKTQSDLH